MNQEDPDQKFLSSSQPARKLSIALERYFQIQEESEKKRRYREYLRLRLRPALQKLIETGENEKLERFMKEETLEPLVLDSLFDQAVKAGNQEAFYLLFREKERQRGVVLKKEKKAESEAGKPSGTRARLAEKIWETSLERLALEAPGLYGILEDTLKERKPGDFFGLKGRTFYFKEETLLELYVKQGSGGCLRLLLHSLFHLLYLHPFQKTGGKEPRLWDLACDILAEYTIKGLTEEPAREEEKEAWDFCRELWQGEEALETWQVYERLKKRELKEKELKRLEDFFSRDSHQFWDPGSREEFEDELFRRLSRAGGALGPGKGQGGSHRGSQKGEEAFWCQVQEQRRRDYHKLLWSFMTEKEELQTDTESFDYIPYLYGLAHYGRLPLIENLEYTEARKLEELVIAIDTSSSCKREQVQRFLEETWSVLERREDFFKKMRVHILQCDCYIQESVLLTSREEWKDYLRHIRIQGRGGTDFRPVFDHVEELKRQGKIRNLKGLFYFTDGDGIYPTKKTDYETVFLLTREPPEEAKIPSWVRLVYMDERDKGEEL